MDAVEHFERAMNHIRLAVEDLGMECGCSEKVELHIPERAFEPLVRSLKEKTMLYCSGFYGWSYPATTFKYRGMKIRSLK